MSEPASPAGETAPMTRLPGQATVEARSPRTSRTADSAGAKQALEERIESLAQREQRAKLAERFAWTIRAGAFLWLAFGIMDLVAIARGVGPTWVFAVGRLSPLAVGLSMLPFVQRRELSIRTLRGLELVLFAWILVCATSMASLRGGWTSYRLPTVSLVILTHAAMLGSRWQRTLIPVVTMTLAIPATLAVESLFVPAFAAQLRSATAIEDFVLLYAQIIGAGVVSLVVSQTLWKLRQEIAASRSIGRYRLQRRIGSGGMGEVWSAYHAGLERDVAVKLVQTRHAEDDVVRERFRREVRALAELTHPNTVRVFDYGATEAGVLYYAMELLDGDDLETLIERGGSFEVERAVRLVTQAAQALGEAHTRSMVHRDIKPANLLVVHAGDAGEYVKLIDFGIATTAEEPGLTQTGTIVGTPGYIAPEVLRGGEASPRSDVYSLTMVLYVLLRGSMPFDADTPLALVERVLEGPPDRPSAHRPDVPEELDALIERCLAADPFQRCADGRELAEALRDAF